MRSSAGSSSSSSSALAKRRSNATPEETSSSTSTRGGSCASTGFSARMRCGERVEGADGGAIELAERHRAPVAFVVRRRGIGRPLLEHLSNAVSQLGSGLLGEGDGCDRCQLDGAGDHEGHDRDRRGRTSCRIRAGFDEERGVEIVRDALPRGFVGRARWWASRGRRLGRGTLERLSELRVGRHGGIVALALPVAAELRRRPVRRDRTRRSRSGRSSRWMRPGTGGVGRPLARCLR